MSKPVPMPHTETLDEMQHLRKPEPFNFAKFLYNTENGTVMGRDRASWGKLCGSYTYYIYEKQFPADLLISSFSSYNSY